MNYQQTLDYLYKEVAMFQRIGGGAMRWSLDNIKALCAHLGQPQQNYPSIHIGGTNGKGSTTHIIAAVLQSAGKRVGMYTSPHYLDFRERIRIDGKPVAEQDIIDFVAKNRAFIEQLAPSFFELTAAMAFHCFAKYKVDIAVVEVGLGGRLDATNILKPLLCIITNIGMDHQNFLGDTLPKIAAEKGGIIKEKRPVLIGQGGEEINPVFEQLAKAKNAPIYYAENRLRVEPKLKNMESVSYNVYNSENQIYSDLQTDLTGNYQADNLVTALSAIELLQAEKYGLGISRKAVLEGCRNVKKLTGLMGRWQVLSRSPLTIADAAHNPHGLQQIAKAFQQMDFKKQHIVFGLVADKKLNEICPLLPKEAIYYFCQANIPRALDARQLAQKAADYQLKGKVYQSVKSAYSAAQKAADSDDFIYIGGSIFVIAEIL